MITAVFVFKEIQIIGYLYRFAFMTAFALYAGNISYESWLNGQ